MGPFTKITNVNTHHTVISGLMTCRMGHSLFLLSRFQEYLRRSRTDNFLDLEGMGALFRAGQDYLGRNVVVFVGSKCSPSKVDNSKVRTAVSEGVCGVWVRV